MIMAMIMQHQELMASIRKHLEGNEAQAAAAVIWVAIADYEEGVLMMQAYGKAISEDRVRRADRIALGFV